MKPLAIAYLITCLVNGRRYVGITRRTVARRWIEHLYDGRNRTGRMAISRAIAKHGADAFVIEPICSFRSWEDACALEDALIVQWGTIKPHGYNLMAGGKGRPVGFRPSRESVEQSAAKHRGRPCHPNTRAAAAKFHRGRSKPVETKAKIAAAKVGKPRSQATKDKLAAYWAARRAAGEFKTDRPYQNYAGGVR